MFIFVIASKGIGANLLKLGTKRRRTKAQIDEEKEEEFYDALDFVPQDKSESMQLR